MRQVICLIKSWAQLELRTALILSLGLLLAMTSVATIPADTPTGLTAAPGNGYVDVRWNASSGATSYKLVRSSGGTSTEFEVTNTFYSDGSVVNGTTYSYTVAAIQSGATSAASGAVSGTPNEGPLTLADPDYNFTGVGLSWTAATGTVTNYRVETDTGSGFVTLTTVAASVRSYSAPAVSASYRVVALNGSTQVGVSNSVSITITDSFVLPGFVLQSAEEKSAQTSYLAVSGSTSPASATKHVVPVTFKAAGGWSSAGSPPGAGYFTPSPLDYTYLGHSRIIYPGQTSYWLEIVAPGESSTAPFDCTTLTLPDSSVVPALRYLPSKNQLITVNLAATQAIATGTVLVKETVVTGAWVARTAYKRTYNSSNGQWTDTAVGTRYDHETITVTDGYYNVDYRKLATTALALDSRRTYGQPNLDGELPGDPNAELRNVNFSNWEYKGGLFVGNMPAATNDLSGTARLQIWPSGGAINTNTQYAFLSMLHLGAGGGTNAASLQAFAPLTTDPNYSRTASLTTWENKWDLTTSTVLGGLPLSNSSPTKEYVTLPLMYQAVTNGPWLVHPRAASRVGVSLTDESGFAWRYFCSKAYQTTFATEYPLLDGAPRVWLIDFYTKVWP